MIFDGYRKKFEGDGVSTVAATAATLSPPSPNHPFLRYRPPTAPFCVNAPQPPLFALLPPDIKAPPPGGRYRPLWETMIYTKHIS